MCFECFSASRRREDMSRRRDHITREPQRHKKPDRQPCNIELPPAMAMTRRPWIGVVVVVPTLTIAEEADDDVVAAALVSRIVAITPQMRDRVNGPGDVPHQHGAHEDAPNEQA